MYICELCGKSFTARHYSGRPAPRFCSIQCRNTHNSRVRTSSTKRICPVCGHVSYDRKSDYCHEHDPELTFWTDAETAFLVKHYPAMGPDELAEHLNKTREQVQYKACRLGVTLTKATAHRLIHSHAAEYMTHHNPMRKDSVRAKVSHFWQEHPRLHRSISLRGTQAAQCKIPSGLEKQLWAILDDLGLQYETQFIIKPKFVVDVRIDHLIIQADGDYWHGHPERFPNPNQRQRQQQKRDRAQDAYLEACGYTVARIWESDMCRETVVKVLKTNGLILGNA